MRYYRHAFISLFGEWSRQMRLRRWHLWLTAIPLSLILGLWATSGAPLRGRLIGIAGVLFVCWFVLLKASDLGVLVRFFSRSRIRGSPEAEKRSIEKRTSTHFSGNRVNQALSGASSTVRAPRESRR